MKLYSDFTWAAGKLYIGDEYTKVGITNVADKPGMHCLFFEEQDHLVFSEDYYNKTRAKDNAVKYAMSIYNEKGETDLQRGST